jgi:hypothetical protein
MMRNFGSCVPLQVRAGSQAFLEGQASSLVRLCLRPMSAAFGPAASLMEMRGMMFVAFTRVNALFIVCHSHAPGGHSPRPEQQQLTTSGHRGPN